MRFVIRFPAFRGNSRAGSRAESRAMIQATFVSVLLHVGAAVAIFVALGARTANPVPLPVVYEAVLVDLPAGGSGAPAAAQAEPPPAPEPQPPEQSASPIQAVPEEPPPPKKKKKKPKKEEPPPSPAAQPTPTRPASDQPRPPADAATPAAEDTAAGSPDSMGTGLAASAGESSDGVPTIDSDAFQFAYYRAILTNRLRSSWSRPLVPGGLQQPIRCTVHFLVLRSGAITDVELLESSGHAPLDRSALRAVFDANPLPPLPEPYDGDRLAVNFFFELTPER